VPAQDAAAAGVLAEEEPAVALSFEPLLDEPLLDEPDSLLLESLLSESLLAATPPPPERLSVR
jgi:hypothetical protein